MVSTDASVAVVVIESVVVIVGVGVAVVVAAVDCWTRVREEGDAVRGDAPFLVFRTVETLVGGVLTRRGQQQQQQRKRHESAMCKKVHSPHARTHGLLSSFSYRGFCAENVAGDATRGLAVWMVVVVVVVVSLWCSTKIVVFCDDHA